jgi:hypothetical protein
MNDISGFPYAPDDWNIDVAKQVAADEGISNTCIPCYRKGLWPRVADFQV